VRVIATAGHVDHGKSTLVHALTGSDPDRFPEEKARGLTIDLGFAFTTLSDGTVIGFVDVPGHVRFAKNMLAGVGSVDIAMLVVDAREGWMPQTAEHVQILELLGIAHGCVVITKADLVDDATLELARLELDDHLGATSLAAWPVAVCDALSGRGIDDVRAVLAHVCRTAPSPLDLHAPRLWVDRSFSVRGVGTVVTGTLTLGALAVGDEVAVLPAGRSARVRGIESHHESLDIGPPGTRVALNLAGIEHQSIVRGDAIVRPDTFVAAGVVDVALLPVPETGPGERAALHAHLGSGEWPMRWRALGDGADRPLGRLRSGRALPLQPGDRMILRSTARRAVVGGAVVVDVAPPRRAVDAVARDRGAGADPIVRALASGRIATAADIARRAGIDRADGAAAAARSLEAVSDRYALPATVDALVADAARRVRGNEDGVELTALAAQLGTEATVLRAAITQRPAVDLEVAGGTVRSRSAPAATIASTPDGARLLAALQAEPYSPPSPESIGIASRVGKLLAREGAAIELDGVLFASDAVDAARRIVGDAVIARGSLTIADVRDLLGSTRKYVLPIAKYLDSEGVTRRRGDDRIPGPRAQA
jgi:selenocysteine-specific elongation factor